MCLCVWWWGWGNKWKICNYLHDKYIQAASPYHTCWMKGWVVRQEMVGNFDEAEVKMKSPLNHAWAPPGKGLVTLFIRKWPWKIIDKVLFSLPICYQWLQVRVLITLLPWGPTAPGKAALSSVASSFWAKCSYTCWCGPTCILKHCLQGFCPLSPSLSSSSHLFCNDDSN